MKKIILIVAFCFTATVQAQYKQPYFNMLTVENGLPQAGVNSQIQDRIGYLWFGTSNGLVRFDGYHLKQYPFLNEDGLPLNLASINHLFEDKDGALWCYVGLQGFYRLDRKKDVFVRVYFNDNDDNFIKGKSPNRLFFEKNNNIVWAIASDNERDTEFLYNIDLTNKKIQVYNNLQKGNQFIPASLIIELDIDASGKIWMITDSLLHYYEPGSKSFKPVFSMPKLPNLTRFLSVRADPIEKNIVWLHTTSFLRNTPTNSKDWRGLFKLNINNKQFMLSIEGSNTPGSLPINCFHTFIDSLKRVWISTEKGIARYDHKSGGYIQYSLKYPNKESHAEEIAADKDGNLWITGNRGGLFFLDIKTGNSTVYESNGSTGDLPLNRSFGEIFFDRFNTLWINVFNEGIAWRDAQKTQFAPVPIYPFSKKTINKAVPSQYNMIGKEGDSICYLTDTANLIAWNIIKNTFTRIDLKNKELYTNIINVSKSKDGSLWLSCGVNGMVHYDPVSGKVTNYRNDKKDINSIPAMFIIDVAAGPDGIIWMGTSDKGIISFDPITKKFTQYPFVRNNGLKQVKDSLDAQTALCLYIDDDGIVWIGTNNGGVNSFNPRTNKFRSYLNYKEGFFGITSIYVDSRKRIWATSFASGLFLLDKKTGALKRFTEKEGLIHNSTFDVREDAEGNIWVATQKGMSRINTTTNVITNFGSAKPWIGFFFIKNLYDRNGFFNLTGKNGIIRFNPLQLGESKTPPIVHIESLSYRLSAKSKDSIIYTEGLQEIKVNHDENRITFHFVALHTANPEQNQYAYQLTGYDKDWIQAGTQRSATYNSLSPGTYTFKVKASNSIGVWNETGASFTITISPPWWNTWWAYCLYALFFILAGYLIYKYQKYYILTRERERTREKELAQAKVIEKAYNDLKSTQQQLIQSEKMASLGELTAGIAHEIQNPLNFVNNFSEVNKELLAEMREEIKKKNYDEINSIAKDVEENEEKIIFHGKRADAIVKSMLQHSRSSNNKKEPTDINGLCDEYLRLAYHGLRAKDKSFNASMKTSFDVNAGSINIIPQDIGRVILNLITNAFYVVNEKRQKNLEGYDPLVEVITKKLADNVLISVKDNGDGIPPKVLDKIFQPFFTTKPTGQGTGLGLSLSYDIVKAHGGELKVETKEGQGSEFIISIPV